WQKAVHFGVCAKGHRKTVPHHADAHALQRRPIRRGQLQDQSRTVRDFRQGRLHFRLPGCPRALDVGRRVRKYAAAQAREARPEPIEEAPPRAAATKNPNSYDFFLRLGPLSNVDEKVFKGDIAFWNEMMRHPNYDEFWQARNLRPHLKNIHPAVMTVGGWFDA